jgi:hypothetical protein
MSSPVPVPVTAPRAIGLPPLGESDGHALRLDPGTERELWGLIFVLTSLRVVLWLI